MPKHQIIRDAGQSLLGVLRAELLAQRSKAKAFLAAPTPEFLRKNAPCLVLYLYDVRPFVDVRIDEKWHLEEEIVDEKGESVMVRYGRPLELDLRFLLTASDEDAGDEHELLALGMKAFLDHARLSGELLQGDSFFKHDALPIAPDADFDLGVSSTVFGGFGAGPRLAVGYRAQARLVSGKELGRSKRVRERHIDVFDPLRPPQGSVSAKELGLEAKSPKIVASPAKK
jgi:hypothetical protein